MWWAILGEILGALAEGAAAVGEGMAAAGTAAGEGAAAAGTAAAKAAPEAAKTMGQAASELGTAAAKAAPEMAKGATQATGGVAEAAQGVPKALQGVAGAGQGAGGFNPAWMTDALQTGAQTVPQVPTQGVNALKTGAGLRYTGGPSAMSGISPAGPQASPAQAVQASGQGGNTLGQAVPVQRHPMVNMANQIKPGLGDRLEQYVPQLGGGSDNPFESAMSMMGSGGGGGGGKESERKAPPVQAAVPQAPLRQTSVPTAPPVQAESNLSAQGNQGAPIQQLRQWATGERPPQQMPQYNPVNQALGLGAALPIPYNPLPYIRNSDFAMARMMPEGSPAGNLARFEAGKRWGAVPSNASALGDQQGWASAIQPEGGGRGQTMTMSWGDEEPQEPVWQTWMTPQATPQQQRETSLKYRQFLQGQKEADAGQQMEQEKLAVQRTQPNYLAGEYAKTLRPGSPEWKESLEITQPKTSVTVQNKPATSQERENIIALERFVSLGKGIKDIWKPEYTGPIEGRVGDMKSKLGVNDPQQTIFLQRTKSLVKKMYQESGKQLSDKEWERLQATFPQTKMLDESFSAAMDDWLAGLGEELGLRREALEQSGFIAPIFGQGIGADLPTATNPETGETLMYKDGQWIPLQ